MHLRMYVYAYVCKYAYIYLCKSVYLVYVCMYYVCAYVCKRAYICLSDVKLVTNLMHKCNSFI
jgi:hypothetical protein